MSQQIPETKFLDKENKTNAYYVWKELGIRKTTRIENSLSLMAQKNLRLTESEGGIPTEWACSTWLKTYGGSFDECRVSVLEHIIEPVTPGSRNVKWLFENEKLDLTEDEIDALVVGFLETPLYKLMAKMTESQTKSNETSPITESATGQPESQEQVLSDTSQENTGIS